MARLPGWVTALGVGVAAISVLPLVWILLSAPGGQEALSSVFQHPRTVEILGRSLAIALGMAALCVGIALPTAWLLQATDLPFRRFFSASLILPLAVPSYVSGYVIVAMLGPSGPLRGAAQALGLALPDVYGTFGIVLSFLFMFPLALLPIRAALADADPRQFEAARSLGMGPLAAVKATVWPGVRAAAASGGLLVALYVISDFGAVSLLRYPTLSYVIYLRYKSPFGREEALVFAALLVAAALVLFGISRLFGGQVRASRGARQRREWPRLALGAWKGVAVAWCGALVTTFVGVPVGTLVYWIVRGMAAQQEVPVPWKEATTTLALGFAGTAVVLALATFPALLGRRLEARSTRWVRGAVATGYALPGITVALAFVFFGSQHASFLYQTFVLLLIAYAVRFLPLGVGSLAPGLDTQSVRVDEAAVSLGVPHTSVWRRINLPAARPGYWAGAIAVYVAIVKELPVTLLLSPLDTQTLATRVWAWTSEAYFAAAAAPAILIVAVASLPLIRQMSEER